MNGTTSCDVCFAANALLRDCPKCKKSLFWLPSSITTFSDSPHTGFIKDHGVSPLDQLDLLCDPLTRVSQCNSMYCTNCYTTSCYVCRRQISGHGHFTESTCQLYDDVNERHRKEVRLLQPPPPSGTHRCTQVGDAQKKAVAESGSNVQTWVKMHFASPTP